MSRQANNDLSLPWKVPLPATLAGRVEYMLQDPVHGKPIYGARTQLIASLLEWWVARESGSPLTHVPTITELRERT